MLAAVVGALALTAGPSTDATKALDATQPVANASAPVIHEADVGPHAISHVIAAQYVVLSDDEDWYDCVTGCRDDSLPHVNKNMKKDPNVEAIPKWIKEYSCRLAKTAIGVCKDGDKPPHWQGVKEDWKEACTAINYARLQVEAKKKCKSYGWEDN